MTPGGAPPAGGGSGGEALACGADPDALLTQVADGHDADRDAHQEQCPHCQATLIEYARLWAPFDQLAAAEIHAPPAVTDRALAAIRQSAGPTGWGRVEDPDGAFLVAARAVVSVAGHAARTSPGVRMALSHLGRVEQILQRSPRDGHHEDLDAGVSGQSVALVLTVAAEYGHDLHRLAEHLRDRVADEVRAQTGLTVVNVDVSIDDVFTPQRDAGSDRPGRSPDHPGASNA